jgi:pectate lyase
MPRLFFLTVFTFLLFVFLPISAKAQSQTPAFPGAEGFGAVSQGGRGGKVYLVTNLNNSGTGSLRECISASGPRICVFKIGGLITISSPLTISNPYITIAGQTAPGGGITIKTAAGGDIFPVKTHDVIIRYISARPGPGGENHASQIASNGTALYNIMVDHSTFSWGVDSDIETWYRVYDSTIQWSIISEGLDCSTHSKGCHSKGLMIGGYAGSESKNSLGSENISILNNLMSNNVDRNPLMQMCGIGQVINNVTYNASTTFSHQQLNCKGSGYEGTSYINWINNYHKKGPNGSQTDLKIIPSDGGVCSSGKVYMSGNVGNNGSWSYSFSGSCDANKANILVTSPAPAPSVSTTSANDAYSNVLAEGGAGNSRGIDCNGNWFNRRDSIDTRIVGEVKTATATYGNRGIIDDPSQVGGWITPASGTACVDSDSDGIADSWELAYFGNLSRGSSTNSSSDYDADGYTDLEEFINGTNPKGGSTPIPTTPSTPTPTPTSAPTYTPGDINKDRVVNIQDFVILSSNFGTSNSQADINSDGIVNIQDFVILSGNFGKTS